jgi:predicted negative regulator of RcsB-dependent stress response
MAKHFDLEEQEQLDQIKHFWRQYGNAILWLLIIVFGSFAAWNGYQYWERRQANGASALYDEVERAAQAGDTALLERAATDIRERYGRTAFASQAVLLAARVQDEKKNAEATRALLRWVVDNGADEGYKALARLRLAAVFMESKSYDEALQVLQGGVPASFEPLVAERRGDVLVQQGKREEAKAQYTKAYERVERNGEQRVLLEIKLNALGVDPLTLKGNAPADGDTGAKK